LGLLLAVSVTTAQAQIAQQNPGAPVTMTGARGDVATRTDCVAGAGAAQATLTLQTPIAGQSNYIVAVGSFGFVSAAAATNAAPVLLTTTGFNGTSASVGFPLASAT